MASRLQVVSLLALSHRKRVVTFGGLLPFDINRLAYDATLPTRTLFGLVFFILLRTMGKRVSHLSLLEVKICELLPIELSRCLATTHRLLTFRFGERAHRR